MCRVENTRWPVSASVSASEMDSRSRISPTSRTSGSSRSAERSARSKEGLSVPTSRWVMADKPCLCTYSIGSSMVRMCTDRVSLIRAMMEASVVDFPDPVGPVRSTRPRGRRASHSATGGRPSSSKVGMSEGIIRSARAMSPFWVNALPRRRARSSQLKEKSTSPLLGERRFLLGIQHPADDLFDRGTGQHGRVLDRGELPVHPDAWLGSRREQQVRPLVVPQNLQPRGDGLDVGALHGSALL